MYQGKFSSGKKTEQAEHSSELPQAVPDSAEQTPAEHQKKKGKKRPSVGTIVFYSAYAVLVLGFCFVLLGALNALKDWLTRYEASQPDVKCQQVFDDLFRDPDWELLYDAAGIQSTRFEDKTYFAKYMKERIGDGVLTYNETSAGLSGNHKYIVKLGNEKIASFLLLGDEKKDSDIREWTLGDISLFYTADQSVTILTQEGRQVLVNGVPLNENDCIRKTLTYAERYLPEGLSGRRTNTYQIDGLLLPPEVTVLDENGQTLSLDYDEATHTYSEPVQADAYDESERARVLETAQVYCRYMIGNIYLNQLRQYFDPNSEIYNTIGHISTWMQSYSGYTIDDGVIHDFCRYSDDLFSARVTMTMYVTRWDKTVKEYALDSTFFFTRIDGKWMVSNMTNVDVQKEIAYIRLTYVCDDRILGSGFVDAESAQLTAPLAPVPEGKTFAGWFRRSSDESGKETYQLVFQPDENSVISLPDDIRMDPMTLYALFEDEEAAK